MKVVPLDTFGILVEDGRSHKQVVLSFFIYSRFLYTRNKFREIVNSLLYMACPIHYLSRKMIRQLRMMLPSKDLS